MTRNEANPGMDEIEAAETLAGKCSFCGANPPPDATTCPECGRPVGGDLVVQPRKPIWVRALVWLVLLLLALGAVMAVVNLVGRLLAAPAAPAPA